MSRSRFMAPPRRIQCTAHKVWQVKREGTTSLRKVGYREQVLLDDGHNFWLVLLNMNSRQSQFHVANRQPYQRAFQKYMLMRVHHRVQWSYQSIPDVGRVTPQDSVSGAWSVVPLILDATLWTWTWVGVARFIRTQGGWAQS